MPNEHLENAIRETGLTLEAFAEVIQVDPKSVQRWITGNTIPYPRHRKAISRALNLTEQDLWPRQPTPRPGTDRDRRVENERIVGGCDVIASWGYADENTSPDPVAFITASDGPIDLLDNYCGIELTGELTDALAAQAVAGREIRVLTGPPTESLAVLLEQQNATVRADDLWVEFWFLRAGERMLFAINFQDDLERLPPPVLELTGTVAGGLFDRAQNKFEELWQQAEENPETLLSTREQLAGILSALDGRDHTTATQAQPPPERDNGPGRGETGARPSIQPPVPASQRRGSGDRRWPGRTV